MCSGVRVSCRALKLCPWCSMLGAGSEQCRRELMSSLLGCARGTLAVRAS